nr:TauD/TfdA family dioxygenase [Streptomyces sp. NBC_00857]
MSEFDASAVKVTPLTGSVGARIDDLDTAQIDGRMSDFLKGRVQQYGVVFLPGQSEDLDVFVGLGHAFGDVQPAHPIKPGLDGHPELLGNQTGNVTAGDVRPRDAHNRQGGNWHIDGTFGKDVPVYSMLLAKKTPTYGGDTLFADLAGAYAALSEPFRTLVGGLVCDHDARMLYPQFLAHDADVGTRHRLTNTPTTPQPLVHTDPMTGRKSLVLNPNCITGIRGLSPLESDMLLDLLMNYATIPERTVRWKWSPGDVVIWDNRRLLHNYVFDHGNQDRFIVRLIVGAEPFHGPTG